MFPFICGLYWGGVVLRLNSWNYLRRDQKTRLVLSTLMFAAVLWPVFMAMDIQKALLAGDDQEGQ